MSDQNSKITNRAVWEAWVALVEIGRATKPQMQADGTQRPAFLHLPADGIGFRLALCRNSLRPIVETIEEKQMELQVEHGVKGASLKTPEERQKAAAGIEACNAALTMLMKEEIEWQCPAPVKIAQVGERELSPEWLAALAAAGILVGEPVPEDAKKPKKKITQSVEVE